MSPHPLLAHLELDAESPSGWMEGPGGSGQPLSPPPLYVRLCRLSPGVNEEPATPDLIQTACFQPQRFLC